MRKKYIYDSVKFIIDLNKRIVFMFYNDMLEGHFKPNNEVTNRKRAFMCLFDNVSASNLIAFDISKNLLKYFGKYIEEINDKNSRKLISIIETICMLGSSNSVKSIASNFKHSKPRLEAIKYAIDNEEHRIATLECIVNSRVVRLRNEGYIALQNSTFQTEVIEDVWKEFFN